MRTAKRTAIRPQARRDQEGEAADGGQSGRSVENATKRVLHSAPGDPFHLPYRLRNESDN